MISQLVFIAVATTAISAQTTTKTFRLNVVEDVTLERPEQNFNSLPYLIVGWHPGFPKKRSLMKFQNIPSECDFVQEATLHIYFLYAHKASYMTNEQVPSFRRRITAQTVLKSWTESQATSRRRFNHVNWAEDYLKFGTDVASLALYTTDVNPTPGGLWYTLDVVPQVQDWKHGNNYGLLLRDLDEVLQGRDFRFASNAYADTSKHAYITLRCWLKQQANGGGRSGDINPPFGGENPQ